MEVIIPQSKDINEGKFFEHIETTLECARFWGNRASVVEPVECPDIEEFRKIYKHQSPNEPRFERWCLEQWLYMPSWVASAQSGVVMKIDSDVLLFCDVGKVYAERRAVNCPTNPFFEGFIDQQTAHDLAHGIMTAFRDKTAPELCKKMGGHVADMYLIPALIGQNYGLSHPEREALFDLQFYNPCGEPGYEPRKNGGSGHKDVWFVNGQPIWVRAKGNAKLLSIHCWGPAKKKVPEIWAQAKASMGGKPVRLEIGV